MIDESLLKQFYDTFDIKPIERPKYFAFHEFVDGKCYPKINPEAFIKILNVLWKEEIDMNVDNDPDLEDLIHYRGMSYQDRVIQYLSEVAPIYMEDDIFNNISYEIRQILKE